MISAGNHNNSLFFLAGERLDRISFFSMFSVSLCKIAFFFFLDSTFLKVPVSFKQSFFRLFNPFVLDFK